MGYDCDFLMLNLKNTVTRGHGDHFIFIRILFHLKSLHGININIARPDIYRGGYKVQY